MNATTVIGLGPMGRAMAATLLRAGHPVTVWNRTPARADALVAAGATRAASPAEAVAAGDLIILSLTDYRAMDEILGPAADLLPGAMATLTDIPAMVGDGTRLARELEAGEHPGDLSTARMMGATADHILRTSAASGVDTALPEAVRSHYARAIAAGHGDRNWTALYEVVRRP